MRVLLDESLPRQLARELGDHEVATVSREGWAGMKNGALLQAAADRFEVFVTADQGIPFQQNLAGSPMGIVVVRAISNRMQDLLPLVPEILSAIGRATPGSLEVVGS